MNEIDIDTLRSAVEKTSRKRGSENELADWDEICEDMKQDAELIKLWDNYISNNPYSQGVTFEDVMKAVEEVGKRLK